MPPDDASAALLFVATPFMPADAAADLAALRPFYALAEAIAADPTLDAAAKAARFEALRAALRGESSDAPADWDATVGAAADRLHRAGLPRHILDVTLQAYRQDALRGQPRDWSETLNFARHATAPLGALALARRTVSPAAARGLEALCCAWWLLALVQRAGTTWRAAGRVALPARWFKDRGATPDALGADACSPALRRVFDDALAAADRLLAAARDLPRLVADRDLAAALAAHAALARRYARRLGAADPLAGMPIAASDRRLALIAGLPRRLGWRR